MSGRQQVSKPGASRAAAAGRTDSGSGWPWGETNSMHACCATTCRRSRTYVGMQSEGARASAPMANAPPPRPTCTAVGGNVTHEVAPVELDALHCAADLHCRAVTHGGAVEHTHIGNWRRRAMWEGVAGCRAGEHGGTHSCTHASQLNLPFCAVLCIAGRHQRRAIYAR